MTPERDLDRVDCAYCGWPARAIDEHERPICGMCVARRKAGDTLSPPCAAQEPVQRPTRRDPDE